MILDDKMFCDIVKQTDPLTLAIILNAILFSFFGLGLNTISFLHSKYMTYKERGIKK